MDPQKNIVGNRNVVFITADQLRADCIVENGKYSKFVKTPSFDRLKKIGVSFEKDNTQRPVLVAPREHLYIHRDTCSTIWYMIMVYPCLRA